MNSPVNPSFTIEKWGVRGCTFHGHVIMMLMDQDGVKFSPTLKGRKKASNHKELGQSEQSIPKGETNRFKQYA